MNNSMFVWKDERINKQYDDAFMQLYTFFEDLLDMNANGEKEFNNLTYRNDQNSYALDIMDAIRNKDILLIEAGVGIGKSFGYLLPIFYTYDNVKEFNKVIISTSSIALQEQLLKDIEKISKMLNIEIKADIAKGINNYACLQRINRHIDDYRTSPEVKEILNKLVEQINKIDSSDKSDLFEISEKIWKQVQLQSKGFCSKCVYSKSCSFYKKQANIGSNNIIITNHANMARNILDKTDLVKNLDMIVFDEAHKLEENIQNIQTSEVQLNRLINQIKKLYTLLDYEYNARTNAFEDKDYETLNNNDKLIFDIEKLFSEIRSSASKNFYKTNKNTDDDYSITDVNRLAFSITPTIRKYLYEILKDLELLFNEIDIYERKNKVVMNAHELQILKDIYLIFKDLLKAEESNNIYWVEFYRNNRISIFYVPKDISNITNRIFSEQVPIICTSGTMLDTQSSYNRFSENVGLNKINTRTKIYETAKKSPYNYAENSLFYYNPSISNPNDKNNYILDLASEISELIKMTEGKALILFTSKKTMVEVYNLLKGTEEFSFELLLHTDTNTNEIKQKFANDTNACLFATGAFWEGIDIKGNSLSNLIITRLPFDQVDAITQYKASKYAKKEQFKQVYFPNMVTKLQQAIGRLIRSDTDTGIVCCLDSRFDNYKDAITPNLLMTNYTTEKSELYQFAETKILNNSTNYTKKLS